MNEGMPGKKEAPTILPTEDVLDKFAITRENYTPEELQDAEAKHAAYEAMHGVLENFENGEMLAAYERGLVPTFASLQQAIIGAENALKQTGDPEAESLGKLLTERGSFIKRWSRRYVTSILQFKRAHQARIRGGVDEREAFIQADADRRRIHDSLLESIAGLNDLLEKAKEFAEYPVPIKWNRDSQLSLNTAWEKPVIFSSEMLQDRDLIRDWAIVADREEEMRKLTGIPPLPPKE